MIGYVETPIGFLQIEANEIGITRIKKVSEFQQGVPVDHPLIKRAKEQLLEYFNQKRQNFDLPLDWAGAPTFYRTVWEKLVQIPFGQTTSYKAIAVALGNPNAVRQVGQANKNNPIAIVVPCHRVIAANGDLQGYFYGLETKRQLLALENPRSFGQQQSLF